MSGDRVRAGGGPVHHGYWSHETVPCSDKQRHMTETIKPSHTSSGNYMIYSESWDNKKLDFEFF